MKGSSIYLTIYNALSYISWTYVFVGCLLHLKGRFMISNYYPPALLFIVQTLNVLDIIHVVAGLVQTSLFLTFIQVLSRIVVLWIPILFIMRRNVSSAGPFLCSLAWSLADLIRYLYYICTPSQLNIPLPFIRTLRYYFFIIQVQYVCGAVSYRSVWRDAFNI
ncbi:Very-long-chain (3R)-3-hydroxyacyl-CoA dehydratase hpo-8 [Thelohanellus kitauei]|uniref:Very-long-chain (3R)-3-hydroxyacyl-CoA dehydratase n=1 Tax=Thelohanellus kitauei TaxID=669202 RepID=A0A0C2ID00_THEKT|nr:Very-long-chain (3R)-3-hydroxyacyl-CoA dehydratase hpo-8 [Thelohanellus kitauei]